MIFGLVYFCYLGNRNNHSESEEEDDPLNSSGGFAVQGEGTKRIIYVHE